MKEYLFNYFIWWYFFKSKEVWEWAYSEFIFMMNLTGSLPMLKNLKKPLFGDKRLSGRIVGFGIRSFWGFLGMIISVIYFLPYLLLFLIYLIIPFSWLIGLILIGF